MNRIQYRRQQEGIAAGGDYTPPVGDGFVNLFDPASGYTVQWTGGLVGEHTNRHLLFSQSILTPGVLITNFNIVSPIPFPAPLDFRVKFPVFTDPVSHVPPSDPNDQGAIVVVGGMPKQNNPMPTTSFAGTPWTDRALWTSTATDGLVAVYMSLERPTFDGPCDGNIHMEFKVSMNPEGDYFSLHQYGFEILLGTNTDSTVSYDPETGIFTVDAACNSIDTYMFSATANLQMASFDAEAWTNPNFMFEVIAYTETPGTDTPAKVTPARMMFWDGNTPGNNFATDDSTVYPATYPTTAWTTAPIIGVMNNGVSPADPGVFIVPIIVAAGYYYAADMETVGMSTTMDMVIEVKPQVISEP